MLYGDDFEDKNDLTGKDYAFYQLFKNCTKVVDAHNLILPATTLAYGCYYYMFYSCKSLTKTPELPATTLASDCYSDMFKGDKNPNAKCNTTEEYRKSISPFSKSFAFCRVVVAIACIASFVKNPIWEVISTLGKVHNLDSTSS